MGRKGWDEPGSICLEKTQTHRIGLSEKVPKVGREEEKEAHHKSTRMQLVTPRANHAKRKGGNLTGAGTRLPERGQALYYQRWGGCWLSTSNPQCIFAQKTAPGTVLVPQGCGTQWGKATVLEFPHSLLPRTGERDPGTTLRHTHKTSERCPLE